MVKEENVTTVITAWGSYQYKCKCENCGRTYTMYKIGEKTSPLCGICRSAEQREKSKQKRQQEIDEAYYRGYNDAMKLIGSGNTNTL